MDAVTVRIFMAGHVLTRSLLALFALAFLASCAELPPPRTTGPATAPTPMPYTWNGDGVSGAARIVVSIGEQRAYFFKGKTLVGESAVSTGKAGFSTPPGQYRVVWKNIDHVSTRFGNYVDDAGNVVVSNVDSRKDRRPPGARFDGASMPFAMFFKGGYAMHQGYVPPYAASHGCIRLPPVIAEIFFQNAPLGTPVEVKQGPAGIRALSPPVPVQPAPLGPAADFAAAPRTQPPVSVRVPAPTPAANLAPASRTRPSVSVRGPAPTPAAIVAPAPRTRTPVAVRAPAPTPVPTIAPTVRTRASVPVRAPAPTPAANLAPAARTRPPGPAPLRSPSPAPMRPTYLRSTAPGPAPVRSPAPAPVRSPAAVRSVAPPSVRPTPIPALSPPPGPGRTRVPVRRPSPSPTPTPARR